MSQEDARVLVARWRNMSQLHNKREYIYAQWNPVEANLHGELAKVYLACSEELSRALPRLPVDEK